MSMLMNRSGSRPQALGRLRLWGRRGHCGFRTGDVHGQGGSLADEQVDGEVEGERGRRIAQQQPGGHDERHVLQVAGTVCQNLLLSLYSAGSKTLENQRLWH